MMITTMEWLVICAGIAAIAWVNWYFFLAERSADGKDGTDHVD